MAKTTTAPPTDAEIEAARALVAAADAAAAEKADADRAAFLAPVQALVAMPEWTVVRDAAAAIRGRYLVDVTFSTHLYPIADFMDQLGRVVEAAR